jgi:Putative adipose-regulatory protein (Seipin)
MSTNTEGIQERRRLPPATTMSSVEGVVTRIAAQILHRHDGQQQQQHHDFYHHDAQYYNNYSFFDKGPPPPPAEFGGIIPFIGRMLKLWILTSALLLASATSYITAYHTVLMPPRCATVPLFFECTTTTDMVAAAAAAAAAADMHATSTSTPSDSHAMDLPSRRFYFGHHQHQYHREKKQQQQEQIVHVLPSSASSSSSSATATVDLFARHDSWEAFHPSVIPPPVAQKRLLQSRQAYYIELSLKLPASNHNQQGAGIFGVHTARAWQRRDDRHDFRTKALGFKSFATSSCYQRCCWVPWKNRVL